MTIASAFNDIAVAHGGAADTSGTIAGAVDALNDALAGSDQPKAETIEGAIALLGDHIGGNPSPTQFDIEAEDCSALFYVFSNDWSSDNPGTPITEAIPGTPVCCVVTPDDGYTFDVLEAGLSPVEYGDNWALFIVTTQKPLHIFIGCTD